MGASPDDDYQATMDQEIDYAASAGVKYWAFDIYPDGIGMSNGTFTLTAPARAG